MRILVAGGQGQVGSALAQQGREQGLDLVALGRSDLDITNAASIAAAFEKYQPELLINSAAYTAVDRAESEVELAYSINEKAAALLADACATANIPMLHISTDYVFDGSKEGLYTEADPVSPLAVYAKSKEAGECAVRAGVNRHIILRTSWVFGLQGNNFVKTMLGLAKNRDCLTVVADQFGGPSSARSIAQVLLKIATEFEQHGSVAWGTYHYCQKPYVSWYEFAREIIRKGKELGVISQCVEVQPIRTDEFKTRVARPVNSRLDTSMLQNSFGLNPSRWECDLDDLVKQFNKS